MGGWVRRIRLGNRLLRPKLVLASGVWRYPCRNLLKRCGGRGKEKREAARLRSVRWGFYYDTSPLGDRQPSDNKWSA